MDELVGRKKFIYEVRIYLFRYWDISDHSYSFSKTNLLWNTGKTLPRTRLKTPPNQCTPIVYCSNHQGHQYLLRFASR